MLSVIAFERSSGQRNHSILFGHNSLPVHQWSINRCSFALLSCVNTPRLQDNCIKKNEIYRLFSRDLKSMCFFVRFWCSRTELTLPAQRPTCGCRHRSSTISQRVWEKQSNLDASLVSAIGHSVCVSRVSSVRLPYVLEVAILDVFKPSRLDLRCRARSVVATCEQSPGASWDIWPNLRYVKRVGTPEILEWRFLGVAPGCGRVDELRGFRFSDWKHDFFEDIYIYIIMTMSKSFSFSHSYSNLANGNPT